MRHPDDIMTAREAIIAHLDIRRHEGDRSLSVNTSKGIIGGAGSLPCPVCKAGRLEYSRASSNGHIAASCTTQACVHWME